MLIESQVLPQIDTTIIPSSTSEYEYEAKIGQDTVAYFNDPTETYEHLVAVQSGDKRIRFLLRDSEAIDCFVQGSTMVYMDAFTDTNIYYNASEGKLKEDIVLASSLAPHEFAFDLESVGVTPRINEDCSIDYLDEAGAVIWTIQAPYATDAEGKSVEVNMAHGTDMYMLSVHPDADTIYPITLDPTVVTGVTAPLAGNGRRIVRTSSGVWYTVLSVASKVLLYRSTNSGVTWTAVTFPTWSYSHVDPSIAVDSQDNIHIAFRAYTASNTSNTQILYVRYTGTSFDPIRTVTNLASRTQYGPSIAVDALDNIHLSWHGTDSSNASYTRVKYAKSVDNGTTWPSWENVITLSESVQHTYPSIAVDSQNRPHIAWLANDKVCYTTHNGTAWESVSYPGNIGGGHVQRDVSLVVDSSGKPWVFWAYRDATIPSSNKIAYSVRENGLWSAPVFPVTTGYAQTYPTVSIADDDSMDMLFASCDYTSTTYYLVQQARYNGSTWSAVGRLSATSTASSIWTGLPLRTSQDMVYTYMIGSGYYSDYVGQESLPGVPVGRLGGGINHGGLATRAGTGDYFALFPSQAAGNPMQLFKSTDLNRWEDMNIMSGIAYSHNPAVATDAAGNLHFVLNKPDPYGATMVHYAKYNGTSWSTWKVINKPNSYGQGLATIRVDGAGILHVMSAFQDASTTADQIRYNRSDDGGTTWTTWKNVSNIPNKLQTQPRLAIAADGTLHMTWYGATPTASAYGIWYARSLDNGETWSAAQSIYAPAGVSQYSSEIVIGAAGSLHIVWGGCRHSYSLDNGDTWSTPVLVDDIVVGANPKIQADVNGHVHAVWYATTTGLARLRYAKFDGTAWSPAVDLSDGRFVWNTLMTMPIREDGLLPVLSYSGGNTLVRAMTLDTGTGEVTTIDDTFELDLLRGVTSSVEPTMDTRRPVNITQTITGDTLRGLTASIEPIMDTKRHLVVTEDTVGDVTRCVVRPCELVADTLRPLNTVEELSGDALRLVVRSIEPTIDTRRHLTVTEELLMDTLRRVTAPGEISEELLLDLRRIVTRFEAASADTLRKTNTAELLTMDTRRSLTAPADLVLDTLRETVVAETLLGDTLRHIVANDSQTADTRRRIIKDEEQHMDTRRQITLPTSLLMDTKRIIAAYEHPTANTLRLIVKTDMSLLDTIRKLTVPEQISMDTIRVLSLHDSVTADTLRYVTPTKTGKADTRRKVRRLDERSVVISLSLSVEGSTHLSLIADQDAHQSLIVDKDSHFSLTQ